MASSKPQRSAAKGGAAPPAAAQPPRDAETIEPKLEWLDGAAGYVIRLELPGFKKEEFKVQVDAGGRLTVRGERPAGYVRFHKAFQLPPTANVDGVAGRFDGKVLSLTVPKNPVRAEEMVLAKFEEAKAAAECDKEGAVREEEAVEAGRRFKWAEAAGGKGQMVAAAVAGFALGVFVAHRLLSATNS